VTLFDFELAQFMNKEYALTLSQYTMFPRYSERSMISLCVGVFGFVALWSLMTWQLSIRSGEDKL